MGKDNNKQFNITLNERQLKLLAYACLVTDRLTIGQLNFSLQECCEAAFKKLYKGKEAGKVGSNEWHAMRFEVEEAMCRLRKLCWGVEYGEDHGLYYDETAFVIATDSRVLI